MAAFIVRIEIIAFSPEANSGIDLQIYASAGELVSNGMNPYAFDELVDTRQALRLDGRHDNPWVSQSQNHWDYYVSGNLPLSELLYGVIYRFYPNPVSFRFVFSLLDSILCAVIGIFVMTYWGRKLSERSKILIALGLGVFSPILLVWGGWYYPEDKGTQILLMLLAFMCVKAQNQNVRFYLSAVLLGASMAFKLLGVFLIPVFLFYACAYRGSLWSRESLLKSLGYLSLVSLTTLIWFLPFVPDVFDVVLDRFLGVSSLDRSPMHGSVWRLLYPFAPDYWKAWQFFTLVLLSSFSLWAWLTKRATIELVFVNFMLIFVVLFLIAGSMDRMNIAILFSILIVGMLNVRHGVYLALYYLLAGYGFLFISENAVLRKFIFGLAAETMDRQLFDAIFSAGFIILYFVLFVLTVVPQPKYLALKSGV